MQDLRVGSIVAMLLMATLGGVAALVLARGVLDVSPSTAWLLWLGGVGVGLWGDHRRGGRSIT